MTPARTWRSSKGSIIWCSSAIRRIHLSDLIPSMSVRGPRSAGEIDAREEVADLERRRVRRVGAVLRVVLDRPSEVLAQGVGVGLRGVGRAHQRAPLLD